MTLLTQEKQAILHVDVHRKGQAVKVLWKFDKIPDNFDGFVVIGNKSHPPTSTLDGRELLACDSGECIKADPEKWNSSVDVLPKEYRDLYFRVFLDNNQDYKRVKVRYPDSSVIIKPSGLNSQFTWKHTGKLNSVRKRHPKEVVCPHDWKTFYVWQMRFCYAKDDPDSEKTYPLPKAFWARFNPFYKMPIRIPEGPDGSLFADKMCPYCCKDPERKTLPYTAGVRRSITIGMVGGPDVGKTTYVTSLIYQLEELGYNLRHLDDTTVKRYKKMSDILFIDRQILRKTTKTEPPLIYSLKGESQDCALALCDAAGDYFGQDDMVERTPYLKQTDALILLIDPCQSPELAKALGGRPAARSANMILKWLINEFRKRLTWLGSNKIPTPIAIAFTKSDILRDRNLINRASLWHQPVYHEKEYNLHLHHNIDSTFGEMLNQYDPELFATIDGDFKNFAFFGVSATGCDADSKGVFPKIEPYRVEDPLLWILYQLGVIEGE